MRRHDTEIVSLVLVHGARHSEMYVLRALSIWSFTQLLESFVEIALIMHDFVPVGILEFIVRGQTGLPSLVQFSSHFLTRASPLYIMGYAPQKKQPNSSSNSHKKS